MAAAAWTWLVVILLAGFPLGTATNKPQGCIECVNTAKNAASAKSSSLVQCTAIGNLVKCLRKDTACNKTMSGAQKSYDTKNCSTVLATAVPPQTSLPLLCAALTLSFGFLVFNFCQY
ncbi:hypothetical protein BaRGS_00034520 [Batillaria attramentaria]|uniref:Uncharacterized protein n=1 Tax=Batillaria attramentaria TaxID=370345 RepID=A0ABD0JHQ0_9CAEN